MIEMIETIKTKWQGLKMIEHDSCYRFFFRMTLIFWKLQDLKWIPSILRQICKALGFAN